MGLADQIKDDWKFIDGVKNVTVTIRNADGGWHPIENVKALRRPITTSSGGIVHEQGKTARWHLWTSTLDGHEPEEGDKITVNGTTWIIGSTALVTLDTRLQCECTKARS